MLLIATAAAALLDPNTDVTLDLPAEAGPEEPAPVVGGRDTPAAKWPGITAVFIDGDVGCTGTLVAPRVVLTAGHCAQGIKGVSFEASDIDGLRAEYAVERIVAHPRWARTYDVAIVILDEDVPVEPAVIARGCALDALTAGAAVDVVGYGAVDARGRRYDDQLQAGSTLIIDPECLSEEKGCNLEVSPGGELAAGGNGVDACLGDSGGPIYLETSDGMLLAGVTSRGFDDADLACSEGGIYVRADAVADWIEQEAGVELPTPTCDAAGTPDKGQFAAEVSEEVGMCSVVDARGALGLLPLALAIAGLRRRRSTPPAGW